MNGDELEREVRDAFRPVVRGEQIELPYLTDLQAAVARPGDEVVRVLCAECRQTVARVHRGASLLWQSSRPDPQLADLVADAQQEAGERVPYPRQVQEVLLDVPLAERGIPPWQSRARAWCDEHGELAIDEREVVDHARRNSSRRAYRIIALPVEQR